MIYIALFHPEAEPYSAILMLGRLVLLAFYFRHYFVLENTVQHWYMIASTTTHVVNYKGCIIVIKNVPCEECEQCGEKYYTDEVAKRLEEMVAKAKKMMQELSVMDYTKVA